MTSSFSSTIFRLNVFFAVLFLTGPAWAATYYVSNAGNDNDPGSLIKPYRTVGHALSKLQAGDTLYLRGGTYYEHVNATVSGAAKQRITVSGYAGEQAVIDSGYPEFRAPTNNDWELVDAARGEYRSKRNCENKLIFGYIDGIRGYENERVKLVPYEDIVHFRAGTDSYNGSSSKFYVGPGAMEIGGRCHIRLAKTTAQTNAEARYGKIFAAEKADPGALSISISQASNTLQVSGSYLTFKDITFNQAKRTILLESGAHDVQFENITAWMGVSTVQTNSSSVHHISISGSRILGDSPYWIFWSDMKNAPRPANALRGTSINLKGGTRDWTISGNLIRGSGQDLIGTSNGEDRIFIHHNRMENCGDDAVEIEGKAENGGRDDIGLIQIYENYISNCLVAVSVGQDSKKMTGPLLFYRNVVAFLRDHPVNRQAGINDWNGGEQFGYAMMLKQLSDDYAARNVHYYQNTLVMLNSDRGITPTPANPDGSTFANNIVALVNGEIIRKYTIGEDQVVDGNLYWRFNSLDKQPLVAGNDRGRSIESLEQNSMRAEPGRGTDPQFAELPLNFVNRSVARWALQPDSEVMGPSNFMLAGNSPALGKAVTLSCRGVSGANEFGQPLCHNGKLPDSRTAADVGAIPVNAQSSDYNVFPFVPAAATVREVEPVKPKAPHLSEGAL